MNTVSRDPLFWLCLLAGPVFCIGLGQWPGVGHAFGWPSGGLLALLMLVVVYPLLEEYVFRGHLQPALAHRWPARLGPLSLANLFTSVIFTALHFFFHPPLWAAGVLLPSLVFGFFRERHDGLAAPILLHVAYNLSYALILLP